ncbi:hypothetical protein OQA88_63 [Cercophora sp. LCS_1]
MVDGFEERPPFRFPHHELTVWLAHGRAFDSHAGGYQVLPLTRIPYSEMKSYAETTGCDLMATYSNKVNSGADISAARFTDEPGGGIANPLLGTLGCWLEVVFKDGSTKVVALTNWHVVRSAFHEYDRLGFRPIPAGTQLPPATPVRPSTAAPATDAAPPQPHIPSLIPRRSPDIQHPARNRHNLRVTYAQNTINNQMPLTSGDSYDEMQKRLDRWVSFFDDGKHHLGRQNLDWALIETTTAGTGEPEAGPSKKPPSTPRKNTGKGKGKAPLLITPSTSRTDGLAGTPKTGDVIPHIDSVPVNPRTVRSSSNMHGIGAPRRIRPMLDPAKHNPRLTTPCRSVFVKDQTDLALRPGEVFDEAGSFWVGVAVDGHWLCRLCWGR